MTFEKYDSITIGTGNILENEAFKQAKTPTQEMLICLKSKIDELNHNGKIELKELIDIPDDIPIENNDEGVTKTVVKIFLNEYHEDTIENCLRHVLKHCLTPPSIILAYAPTSSYVQNGKFNWCNDEDKSAKANFKTLWQMLRDAKSEGKVSQLGISDMDLDTIKDIFGEEKYDFTSLQINIATCCIVPPELTQFCKENNIQLLTHSDPKCILPFGILDELKIGDFKVRWVARYLQTLICRGILQKKGFIVNFQRS